MPLGVNFDALRFRSRIAAGFPFSLSISIKSSKQFADYIDSMEEVAEGLLVAMRVRVENEIFQWLLIWGSQVRVLEPESLRRRLMIEAGKILENYSDWEVADIMLSLGRI